MSKDYRDSYHIGNRIPRNPFTPVEVTQHLEWCRTCKMDVDIQEESGNADGVDVYRKICKRCGRVMQHGIGKRHILKPEPLPKKALEFIQKTGTDRR